MRQTIAALAIAASLGTSSVAYAQADPDNLPARDAHQGVVIAVDPYHTQVRAKERFGKKNPFDAGILAVEVVVRNDNDKAVKIDLETPCLLLTVPGQPRQRLVPLDLENVLNKVLYKDGPDPRQPRRRPLPGRFPKPPQPPKEWRELEEKWRPMLFEMDVLPPRSTARGVMFFDVNHHFDWLTHARLYVPNLQFVQDGQALLFFEVDLAPAVKQ
jgi:hypothetical protein